MKLIVGLGNPGKEYFNTRHNIGFDLIDYLASCYNVVISKKKFNALYEIITLDGEKIILVKPLSYMNLSGEVVKKFMDYYNISADDILIIQDDKDMVLGKIKICYNRNSGGHNGINNIILNLNTKCFLRLKIGIGSCKPDDVISFVLGNFSKEEKSIIDDSFKLLSSILEDFVCVNRDMLMSKYNCLNND